MYVLDRAYHSTSRCTIILCTVPSIYVIHICMDSDKINPIISCPGLLEVYYLYVHLNILIFLKYVGTKGMVLMACTHWISFLANFRTHFWGQNKVTSHNESYGTLWSHSRLFLFEKMAVRENKKYCDNFLNPLLHIFFK